jgi:hypothetical protein
VRWEQGRTVIDAMLGKRELERVTPSTEHAAELIAQARRHTSSAQRIADEDPAGAFQLLYDAARKALVAILENQGLRPTSRGGHIAVLEAVSAQLDPPMGKILRPFDRLRRLRNNAEYPRPETPPFTAGDVTQDIPKIEDIVVLAQRVVAEMSPY